MVELLRCAIVGGGEGAEVEVEVEVVVGERTRSGRDTATEGHDGWAKTREVVHEDSVQEIM